MHIYELNDFSEVSAKAIELAQTNKEGIIVAIVDSHWLATGATENTYDVEAQQRFNIPVFQSQHIGGTCVVFPGDLSLCELYHGVSNFGHSVIRAVKEYLDSLNIRTYFDGNDLMIHSSTDNVWRKVASHGSGWLDKGYSQSVVHISIGMDENLVEQICTKPCIKKPGGLGSYGITADAIYNNIVKPIIVKMYKE